MQLTIVYDDVKKTGSPLLADHGFSCYIETDDEVILFDTGTEGRILLHNLELLKKDPKKISKIVISHEHYDHNGGLSVLPSQLESVEIYRIQMDESKYASNITYVSDPQQITESVFSTGRLAGNPVDEQSLILKTGNGNFVLTGCSHPGVDSILQAARTHGNIRGIIGGLHGFNDFSLLEQIDTVFPCHCTKYKERIKSLFPDACHACYVGLTIEI